MFGNMAGKTVFIIGGGRGIGRGIAGVFAGQGANVFLTVKPGEDFSPSVREIQSMGGTAQGCVCEVTEKDSVASAVARAVSAFGGLDVLCANAGIYPMADLRAMSEQAWDETLSANLKGVFLSAQACIPQLERSGSGRIVVISSITGLHTGFAGWSHYGASKAGQLGFIRSAALELAPLGIIVNAVLRGNIATERTASKSREAVAAMEASIPLHRNGKPADVGWAALFLATPETGFITGQTLVVDGGQALPEMPGVFL